MRSWNSNGLQVEQLHHTANADNIADLATKGKVKKEQVDLHSEWQNGPSNLAYERDFSLLIRD